MNKTAQIAGIVSVLILAIAIAFVAITYATDSNVTAASADLKDYVDLKVNPLDDRVTAVELRVDTLEIDTDSLRKDVDRNARCVQFLHNKMKDLGERLTETRNLTVVHGKKINDISETVFKAAFGSAWADSGKAVFDKYVLCGNQEYWDEVMTRLTPEQMQKILQVDALDKRIAALEPKPKPKTNP